MTIDTAALKKIADAYVAAMTSIRGRRVHRLLLREFARHDHVFAVAAEDGTPALLALSEGGSAALCRTDGTGRAVTIVECAGAPGATVVTAFDLLRDSLPIVGWTILHPGLAAEVGALRLAASALAPAETARIAVLLRRWATAAGASASSRR